MSLEALRLNDRPRSVRLVEAQGDEALESYIDELRAEAFAAGQKEAVRQAAGTLDAAAERLDLAAGEALESTGRAAIELALEIARELLRSELDAGRDQLEDIVRQTLHESGAGRGSAKVHLCPEDARRLEGASFRTGTEIVADEGVARGDVQVETPIGCLVREPFSLLESIASRLREELA